MTSELLPTRLVRMTKTCAEQGAAEERQRCENPTATPGEPSLPRGRSPATGLFQQELAEASDKRHAQATPNKPLSNELNKRTDGTSLFAFQRKPLRAARGFPSMLGRPIVHSAEMEEETQQFLKLPKLPKLLNVDS